MRREGPIRVLIADDQELVRSCIRDALRSRKEIQVIGEAKNGDEAIIFCKRNRPDVVLLDICMPKKNGIDATKEILHECESIRIVAISGFIRPDLVRNAIKAGAIGFISKNITDSQLLASILVDACFGRPFFSSDATQVLIDSGKKNEREEPVPRSFSRKEKEIIDLMVIGKSNKEISEKLGVSERSAANYVGRIIEKLDAENRSEAIALAVWYQLTSWRPKSEN